MASISRRLATYISRDTMPLLWKSRLDVRQCLLSSHSSQPTDRGNVGRPNVGRIVRSRIKPSPHLHAYRHPFPSESKKAAGAATSNSSPSADFDVDGTAVISSSTHIKNAALASALLSFCVAVAWYSMNAVGQASSVVVGVADGSNGDPLAALRQEAAAAQDKHDKESRSSTDASNMLKQFQAGDFDPDKYEEEDESQPAGGKKRPWWKVW